MKVLLFLAVISLLAIAPLSPATKDIQSNERALTQEASSLSDVDLASIVLQPGDLPSSYSAGKTEHSEPAAFKKLPKTKYVVHQLIKKNKEIIGGTTIFFYAENWETDLAYGAMMEGLGEPGRTGGNIEHVVGIGERAALAIFNMAFSANDVTVSRHKFREFIFVRCHAVINIRLDDPNTILSYAQKLDQRILDSLCRIRTSRSIDRQQAKEEIGIIRSRIKGRRLSDRYKIDDETALEDVIMFVHDPVTRFDSIKYLDVHHLWTYIGMYDEVLKGGDYFLYQLRDIPNNIDDKTIKLVTYLLHDHHPDGVHWEILADMYTELFEAYPDQSVNDLKTRQDWKSVIDRLAMGSYKHMRAGLAKLGDTEFEKELKAYWAECEKRWERIEALATRTNACQTPALERVDKTIIREADLTRDGKPEKIVLHITGKDFKSPFTWTITIHSNGRQIFYKEHFDNEQFDSTFGNSEFWGDCHDYISCKSKWYFTDVMRLFLYTLDPIHLELMQEKESPFTTFDTIRDLILKTGKATSVQANRIVEDLKRDIENGKAICINPDVHPVIGGPIYLWIPIVDDFVFLYDD